MTTCSRTNYCLVFSKNRLNYPQYFHEFFDSFVFCALRYSKVAFCDLLEIEINKICLLHTTICHEITCKHLHLGLLHIRQIINFSQNTQLTWNKCRFLDKPCDRKTGISFTIGSSSGSSKELSSFSWSSSIFSVLISFSERIGLSSAKKALKNNEPRNIYEFSKQFPSF